MNSYRLPPDDQAEAYSRLERAAFDKRRTDMDRGDSLGFLLAVAILLGLALWICAEVVA